MSNELLTKNLERWSFYAPEDAKRVREQICEKVQFTHTEEGELNLVQEIDGKPFYFSSQNGALKEALEWFTHLNLAEIQILYVYGVGLGYAYDAAKQWINEGHRLIFIEENLEVLHRLFETERGTELLSDVNVRIRYLDPKASDKSRWMQLVAFAGTNKYLISASNAYQHQYPQQVREISSFLFFFLNWNQGNFTEYSNHGLPYFANFYQNLNHLPKTYLAKGLYGKFEQIPAIICGAGPSLDKNLAFLEKLGNKALIFAGGTAMNAVNADGFLPHFGVGIDPNPAQWTRLIMNTAYEVPFLYRNRLYPQALQQIHGPTLYVNGAGSHLLPGWYEEKLQIVGPSLIEGFNVINFSISLAIEMGCNPIILVGVDLAYTDQKSYTSGVISHPVHSRHEDFRTKNIEDELVTKDDIFGQPVQTLWKWIAESIWISDIAEANSKKLFINATEGGIGMPGIPNKPLTEVDEYLLKTQQDMRVWIHGEEQNHSVPSSVTLTHIRQLSEELHQSFQNCHKLYQTQIGELSNNCSRLTAIELDDALAKLKSSLEKEMAYQYVLKDFDKNYTEMMSFDFENIDYALDETPEQRVEKKALLHVKRLQRLLDTSILQAALIEMHLISPVEQSVEQAEPHALTPPIPDVRKEEIYKFENNTVTIEDPELQMNIKEAVADIEQDTIFYPGDTAPKLERFYHDGLLHGPVTFYKENGQLLAQSWYVRGVQQGRARYYYHSGQLYGMQTYRDGKLDGIQSYYYPNGQLKTFLRYHCGCLNGEVWLYYPNGKLKREQHFLYGKREGEEHIWNEDGMLLVEASYHLNKPIGFSRMWHANGQLAQETIYSENSQVISLQRWDELGVAIQQNPKEDVIDKIMHQTDALTKSLEVLHHQLEIVTPALMTFLGNEDAIELVKKDLIVLGKEIGHLKKITAELFLEAGSHSDVLFEPIWKTTSMRQDLQKQLGFLTSKLQEQINGIQNLITQAVEYTEKQK